MIQEPSKSNLVTLGGRNVFFFFFYTIQSCAHGEGQLVLFFLNV